jgi:hypothetical protein
MKRAVLNHLRRFDVVACLLTGLLGGTLYLLLILFWIPLWDGGTPGIMLRWAASFAMGGEILAPPSTFGWDVLAYAVGSFWLAGVVFALIVNFILHGVNEWLGLLGGMGFGLILYGIDFYYFDAYYPWLIASRSTAMVITYIVFGGFVGYVYHVIAARRGHHPIDSQPLKTAS